MCTSILRNGKDTMVNTEHRHGLGRRWFKTPQGPERMITQLASIFWKKVLSQFGWDVEVVRAAAEAPEAVAGQNPDQEEAGGLEEQEREGEEDTSEPYQIRNAWIPPPVPWLDASSKPDPEERCGQQAHHSPYYLKGLVEVAGASMLVRHDERK